MTECTKSCELSHTINIIFYYRIVCFFFETILLFVFLRSVLFSQWHCQTTTCTIYCDCCLLHNVKFIICVHESVFNWTTDWRCHTSNKSVVYAMRNACFTLNQAQSIIILRMVIKSKCSKEMRSLFSIEALCYEF